MRCPACGAEDTPSTPGTTLQPDGCCFSCWFMRGRFVVLVDDEAEPFDGIEERHECDLCGVDAIEERQHAGGCPRRTA